MAHIKSIWFHGSDIDSKEKRCTVHVALKPAGEVQVKWIMPPRFYDAIVAMAQTQADAHEALMRAEILGDNEEAVKGSI